MTIATAARVALAHPQHAQPSVCRVSLCGFEACEALGGAADLLQGKRTGPRAAVLAGRAVGTAQPVEASVLSFTKDGRPFIHHQCVRVVAGNGDECECRPLPHGLATPTHLHTRPHSHPPTHPHTRTRHAVLVLSPHSVFPWQISSLSPTQSAPCWHVLRSQASSRSTSGTRARASGGYVIRRRRGRSGYRRTVVRHALAGRLFSPARMA